ncbi:MAG: VTT domain-containing protein [Bacteroides sp.]|nr:MAG: VTT domain-containing protein [Bacteroides sp.]
MHYLLDLIKLLTNPLDLLNNLGSLSLVTIITIVLIENGFIFGFFLPGDSLLFVAGMLCSDNKLLNGNVTLLILLIAFSAILGNLIAYWIGSKSNLVLFKKYKLWILDRKYIDEANKFYKKYGGFALIIGRFLPVIRTFVPIIAGIVQLNYKTFVIYNIIGAFLWSISVVLSGYYLGNMPSIKENIEFMIILIVLCSSIPLIRILYKKSQNLSKK